MMPDFYMFINKFFFKCLQKQKFFHFPKRPKDMWTPASMILQYHSCPHILVSVKLSVIQVIII